MTRNHASGGDSVNAARSHGRRQSAAEARAARGDFGPVGADVPVTADAGRSPGDLRPGRYPLLEPDTVVLAVTALRERRLPELDRVEVRVGLVGVRQARRVLQH